jgi:hypothetical protein
MSVNARVQKHREKLRAQHRCRVEVCIGSGLLEKVRQIATFQNEPMWSAVQDALEAYVEEYHTLIAEQRRLNEERTRILEQEGSPGFRSQVEAYNRHFAAFTERFVRSQRPRSGEDVDPAPSRAQSTPACVAH